MSGSVVPTGKWSLLDGVIKQYLKQCLPDLYYKLTEYMVFRKIDPEVYSYPHGQCRSVGVGGFLLGGGVNWMGTLNKLVILLIKWFL